MGEMILAEDRRIRELLDQIHQTEKQIAKIAPESEMTQRLATLPGYSRLHTTGSDRRAGYHPQSGPPIKASQYS